MIKQNSIRFAAEFIGSATKYSKNFRDVLLEICKECDIRIVGLQKNYKPEMAPFYFEQAIDRLDEKNLEKCYLKIATKCPELMIVSLYVTGLIRFYAGQIVRKLVEDLRQRGYVETNWSPIIQFRFAGKGARIFDWFKSVDKSAANQYTAEMFKMGFGPMNMFNIENLFDDEPKPDGVKYEVSKGLAKSVLDVDNSLLINKQT